MENKIIFKNHYNDDSLTFNEGTQRYELTIQYVKENFDPHFRDDETLLKRISKTSRKVYEFIYSRGNSHNKEVITFLLNETENGRKFLIEVLSAQMESDILTGANDIGLTPAINFQTGRVIDRNEIKKNLLCVDAEEIIQASAGVFGISIIYMGVFPYGYFLMAKER